ncbi:diacylglycerol kinase [Halopseudomonas oceani]|jgi:diacylglycerol kinase (ATP)|uniref:Diacylglycerol kinase n=1 Tax=Halopseudomonas oceani TaxID=1708783 RepID=A0A2P4F055_9GAMM|nr:diacylglycerol kinase [Halopseudomonas oceani]POB06374.1 diacylglycerol kinase [Halopseudomonas oceani]GGE35939.1 diacylglycerol kinase [Halopseudomonas oceani]
MQPESISEAADALKLKSRGGFIRVFKATGYSLAGLRAAFTFEAAFRQLLFLAVVLIPLAFWLPVSGVERALMVGVVLLALIVELINSAIEAVVDRISLELHPLSKRAKDLGSAAQMLALLLITSVWSLILFSPA